MSKDYLRGHVIELKRYGWVYKDTGEQTVRTYRDCGYCGKANTEHDHDGCIGELPNVMNACCGHGQIDDAYIQYRDGIIIRGQNAIQAMRNSNITKQKNRFTVFHQLDPIDNTTFVDWKFNDVKE